MVLEKKKQEKGVGTKVPPTHSKAEFKTGGRIDSLGGGRWALRKRLWPQVGGGEEQKSF